MYFNGQIARRCSNQTTLRLTVSGVAKGGMVGAMARSNFLMTRRKVLKVKMLKEFGEEEDAANPFALGGKKAE